MKEHLDMCNGEKLYIDRSLYLCPSDNSLSKYKCAFTKSIKSCPFKRKECCNKIYRLVEVKG